MMQNCNKLKNCYNMKLLNHPQAFVLLCLTRWTVRASAMHSSVENYQFGHGLWTTAQMKAQIRGADYHMMKFYFFYGLALGECILCHADSLSTTFQRPNSSASEGQSIASMTVNTLSNLRSEKNLTCFGLMP